MPNFTSNAIKQAFVELLKEKPYSDITVKDIVGKCGINRNSFYYHFSDMPALLDDMIKENIDKLIEEYPSFSSFEECLMAVVGFAQDNRVLMLNIYRSVDRAVFESALWRICDYALNRYGDTAFSGRNLNDSDKTVMIIYYKCECFGQLMAWMENGMRYDIASQLHRLCELKKGHAEEMIDRAETKREKA